MIQTMIIDTPTIRMGSRLIKTFHAAVLAKLMICLPATKFEAAQGIHSFQQGKILMTCNQMQETCPRTDRTVAVQKLRNVSTLASNRTAPQWHPLLHPSGTHLRSMNVDTIFKRAVDRAFFSDLN